MRNIRKEKVKQITTTDMVELIRLAAMEEHIIFTVDMAKWIISVSPHWRSQGYAKIMEAINNIGSVDKPKN